MEEELAYHYVCTHEAARRLAEEALVNALVRVSQLAEDLKGQIAALDVNPLMVLPQAQGVRAVDALVEVA